MDFNKYEIPKEYTDKFKVTERDKTLLNQTEDTFSQYHKLNEFNESYSDEGKTKIKN